MKVWLPSSCPSRTSWRTNPGCRAASLPTTKKSRGRARRRRNAEICGVQRGIGPVVERQRDPAARAAAGSTPDASPSRPGSAGCGAAAPTRRISCGSPLAPIVCVAIPSKTIATAATTKQKPSRRQCPGIRRRLTPPIRASLRLLRLAGRGVVVVFVCPGVVVLAVVVVAVEAFLTCPGAVVLAVVVAVVVLLTCPGAMVLPWVVGRC